MSDEKQRILVVEDEAAIRRLVRIKLDKLGCEVVEAEDGRKAIARLRAEAFDVVFLDLMMPHVDGFSVLKALRAEAVRKDAKVVLVTARRDPKDEALARELGVEEIFYKPFQMSALYDAAKRLLGR